MSAAPDDRLKQIIDLIVFIAKLGDSSYIEKLDQRSADRVLDFLPKLLILNTINNLNTLHDSITFFMVKDHLTNNELKEFASKYMIEEKLISLITSMQLQGLLIGLNISPLGYKILNLYNQQQYLFKTTSSQIH